MIKPLLDYVLIKKIEEDNSTTSGIVLTQENTDSSNIGTIVALGDGMGLSKENQGYLEVGQKVVFNEYQKVTYKNETYYIVNEIEIIAVIED